MSPRIRRILVSPDMGLPSSMSMPKAMATAMAIICRTPAPGEPWEAMGGL